MSLDTAGGVPEGFEKVGLPHQPRHLRGNPNFREGVDYVVIDGIAHTLTQNPIEVERVLRLAA